MSERMKTGRVGEENEAVLHNPKLGFVGTGWIGRSRLAGVVKSQKATVCALVDTDTEMLEKGGLIAPSAERLTSLTELLRLDLDGVVLATPNDVHAEQAVACLEAGCAVFCQKPLGRSAIETARVIDVARLQDRLIGVDLSYRFLNGLRLAKEMIAAGEIGRTFVAELTFHNAYGPDKSWFYDRELAGGGCLIDLGTHLIDAGLWVLNFPEVMRMTSFLFCKGQPLKDVPDAVEDYANVQLELTDRAVISLACSWGLSAGCNAVIRFAFYGTEGSLLIQNVEGSYYDFVTYLNRRTKSEVLAGPPESWGKGAILNWIDELAGGPHYRQEIETSERVAALIDEAYRHSHQQCVSAATAPFRT